MYHLGGGEVDIIGVKLGTASSSTEMMWLPAIVRCAHGSGCERLGEDDSAAAVNSGLCEVSIDKPGWNIWGQWAVLTGRC